ncbi:hypothetical protein [Marichromatium gracile]|uniref:Uncharacterized protein n=1 Tax=Marichromatium gracile TaxID=1048 RepID=A0ABR5VDX4_MARGR|nr:hypothetical protein [Marichromatium gracile]KXX63550.1 hypothetical protein AY586_16345 [Marichromatium gracile]
MFDAPFDRVEASAPFADSDWFHACRQTQTPYVVIRHTEQRADVLWDFVTLPECCDAVIRAHFEALEQAARAIFLRYADAESHLRVKPTLIGFDRLPIEQAEAAADALYALVATYLPGARRTTVTPPPTATRPLPTRPNPQTGQHAQ